ncbi:MAG TPA: hypothetical protein VFV99_22855 [Kofleriaceae bacterium]|nr:hypothetical protein [Kofleriaceae bacterium]
MEKRPGGKAVRDTRTGVTIDFLITGEYPGDGKPKPVQFPDPSTNVVRSTWHGKHVAVLSVPRMLELKLASGISAPHRMSDLADVLKWIRHTNLPRELADQLDPYVRPKYLELWDLAQTPDPIAEDR